MKIIQKIKRIFSVPEDTFSVLKIEKVYEDGIFSLGGGKYSKTYSFTDINYVSLSKEDRREIKTSYEEILNIFGPDTEINIGINNRKMDIALYKDRNLYSEEDEDRKVYARDYNNLIMSGVHKDNSSILERYITLTVQGRNVNEARISFERIEKELSSLFLKMNSVLSAMTLDERLKTFYSFFHGGAEEDFSYNYSEDIKRGYSFQNVFSPVSMKIMEDSFKMDKRYGRVLFVKEYPSYLKDSFIQELMDIRKDIMVCIKVLPVSVEKAIGDVEKRLLGIETSITKWQNRQNRENNIFALLPYDLDQQRTELTGFLEDLKNRDQKMFLVNIAILISGETMEELDTVTEVIRQTGRKHLLKINPLTYQQIEGLNETLPTGNSMTEIYRTLTTESLGVFIPFKSEDINHEGGTFYGRNKMTGNIIRVNRGKLLNGNEFILGVSGSGKSYIAKNEILQEYLKGDSDILIIDPEREYGSLVRRLGGEVVEISPASRTYINPMDMETDITDEDAKSFKTEFLLSFVEQIKGEELSSREKSVLDRCIRSVYENAGAGKNRKEPLIQDLYYSLYEQPESEARELALSMEMFTKGSIDSFSRKTNIDMEKRILCFDIHELGKQMTGLGMLVVLDSIMNRIMRNREKGRRTLIFIDEIYLLFRNEYTSQFLFSLWKRVRKYGSYAVGITQNVEDLLSNERARTMLANSEFVIMLNQSRTDRDRLSGLFSISESENLYVTNSQKGEGLMRIGRSLIPFELKTDTSSSLHTALTETETKAAG